MTLIQILAILSLLNAFGVDAKTVADVRNILIPPIVAVAPIAAPDPINTTPVQAAPGSAIIPSTNPPSMPTPPSLTVTIDSAVGSISSTEGLPILAHLKVQNTSGGTITIGYPNTTVSKKEPPKSAGTEAMLEATLGVSITDAPTGTNTALQFLYENGTKPQYKYEQSDLLYEAITLQPGDVMQVQVRLLKQVQQIGTLTLTVGGKDKKITVSATVSVKKVRASKKA